MTADDVRRLNIPTCAKCGGKTENGKCRVEKQTKEKNNMNEITKVERIEEPEFGPGLSGVVDLQIKLNAIHDETLRWMRNATLQDHPRRLSIKPTGDPAVDR